MNLIEGVTPHPSAIAAVRTRVQALQSHIEKLPQEMPAVHHFFCDGMYFRPMLLLPGHCVIGAIHKQAQMNICSMGDVSFHGDQGLMRVTAGFHYVGQPGTQRAFYAHTESIWTVGLRTDETDIDVIEQTLVMPCEMDYQQFLQRVST